MIKFELVDFNSDNSEELISVYRNSTSWCFNVDTKNHSRIYSYTKLDSTLVLKNTLLFRKNNSWFLATIFTRSESHSYDRRETLNLKIINLSTQEVVDSIDFNPGGEAGDFWVYPSVKIYLYEIDGEFYFYIGSKYTYWGHGPGVDYGGDNSFITQINFAESLSIKKTYSGFNRLIKNGNLVFGADSYSSNYSNGYEFTINSYQIEPLTGKYLYQMILNIVQILHTRYFHRMILQITTMEFLS